MSKRNKKGKPLMMRRIREIYRLHFEKDLSNEQIANLIPCGKGSVYNYLFRLESSAITYSEIGNLSDADLKDHLFSRILLCEKREDCWPDFEKLKEELSRPHVTCQLLWEEYFEAYPKGIKRTSFFTEMSKVVNKIAPSMKMIHTGGEKLYLDYSGSKLEYYDSKKDIVIPVEVFVASFGASSYTYVECTHTQKQKDWVESNVRALDFFKGVPVYLVPDNLKSAVIKADTYLPELNISYDRMSKFFDTHILPARSRRPQDKGVVEANVKAVQSFIFPRLRNKTFTSLSELNEAVGRELVNFNQRKMQEFKESRIDRFEKLDKPYLKKLHYPLYSFSEIRSNVFIPKTYHVLHKGHYYSVPYGKISQRVEIRETSNLIEIYHLGERIASHKIGLPDHTKTTLESHMPSDHKFQSNFNNAFVKKEALKIGPHMRTTVDLVLGKSKYENEVLRKKAYALVLLSKDYSKSELEDALEYILKFTVPERSILKSVLDQNIVKEEKAKKEKSNVITLHENLRNPNDYKGEENVN